MAAGNTQIKQYLLGNLAADEARALDLRIVAEPELEEEFLLAEDDLMDDYLDGILTPTDAEAFRKNFLVSDERLTALRDLKQLKTYARGKTVPENDEKTASAADGDRLRDLKGIFRWNLGSVKTIFALLLICAAIGVGWRLIFYNQPDARLAQTFEESIRLNRDDLSDLSRFENAYQVSLTAGTFRNAGDGAALSADRFNNTVLFRLLLPPLSDSASGFNVRLVGAQKEILTLERVRAYKNPGGEELRVLFPASLVGTGDYRIEVRQENVAAPLVYSFTVR